MSRSPAVDLLTAIRDPGIKLFLEGGRLRFRPAAEVYADFRARMARLKSDLTRLVASHSAPAKLIETAEVAMTQPAECALCGATTWWRARHLGSPWICGVCVPPLLKPVEVEWRKEVGAWS